jgi:hypothetical protein
MIGEARRKTAALQEERLSLLLQRSGLSSFI